MEFKDLTLKKRFLIYAKHVNKIYNVDEENINQLKQVLEIVEEQKKGIVLCGKTGSGKTFIFQVLNKVFAPAFHPSRIAIKVSDDLVSNYEKFGDEAITIKSKNVCIDEIGREKIGKYYGSECDVIQKIIQKRYNDYKYKGYITYFTSNYSKSALRERYGEHTFSRLNEMCIFINLGTLDNYKDRRIDGGVFENGFPEFLTGNELNDEDDNFIDNKNNLTLNLQKIIKKV